MRNAHIHQQLVSASARPNLSLNRTHCGGPPFGLKSLAQMPPRHNGPVSSNVRPRGHIEPFSIALMNPQSKIATRNAPSATNISRWPHARRATPLSLFGVNISTPVAQKVIMHHALIHQLLVSASARPNQSLNRTHCGGPPFGLKNPSPNANPPQWAG